MAIFHCGCEKSCALWAVIVSLLLGVVAAFLQIAGVFTATTVFLWVALGIAVAYLGLLVVTTGLSRRADCRPCLEDALATVLAGILGAILFSAILLAVGIVATSIVSAILVGLLVAALSLIFAGSACLVKCLAGCGS